MTPEHKALVVLLRQQSKLGPINVARGAMRDAADAIESLSSPTAQTGEAIAVKPLEWEERSGAHYADTAFGEACIDEDGDGFYVIESGRKHSGFASVDAAKTFVQKNHNIWVNDWFTHPAPAVPDAVEALRDCLDRFVEAFPAAKDYPPIRRGYEALSALAASHMPVGDGYEPYLWQCKDYADGWITYTDREEALAYQRDTGCLLRITYRPLAASTGEDGR